VSAEGPTVNGQVVLQVFEAINRRDVAGVIAEGTDDLVVDLPASISPHRGIYRGKREVERLYTDFLDTWVALSWEAEDLRELSGDRVIAQITYAQWDTEAECVWTRAHPWRFRRGQGCLAAALSIAQRG
jgi:ketosteroid isomerase-like protein